MDTSLGAIILRKIREIRRALELSELIINSAVVEHHEVILISDDEASDTEIIVISDTEEDVAWDDLTNYKV